MQICVYAVKSRYGIVERIVKPRFTLRLWRKTGIMCSLLLIFLIQQAVFVLEEKIHGHMDTCMRVTTVSTSSRDPPWMTPLLKSIIRTKFRVSCLSKWLTSSRKIGESLWLPIQIVVHGELSQRRRASCKVNLENSCFMDLNDYFAKLCSDDMYVETTPVTISNEVEIPVISERQVWNLLSALKRTATGPDQILYLVWTEHAEIFTPFIT